MRNKECLLGLVITIIVIGCGGGIPSEMGELQLPYLEGSEITSNLSSGSMNSLGFTFQSEKPLEAVRKEFTDALTKAGWKRVEEGTKVLHMGLLYEKGEKYLDFRVFEKGLGKMTCVVGMDLKSSEFWGE
jgi:hypothetical protein